MDQVVEEEQQRQQQEKEREGIMQRMLAPDALERREFSQSSPSPPPL